jgi:hypothetical protein
MATNTLPNRDEAAKTRWPRLDAEREVLALCEPREPTVDAIANDRADARELGQAVAQELAGGHDVVRPSAVGANGNPRISTRSVRFVPIVRPHERPASWNVGP